MTPTHDEFLDSHAEWNGTHMGIAYTLSWHGRSEYNRSGTWCWYICLREEQFYADDWKKLRLESADREFAGSRHRHWNYDDFPDIEAHGGWTYGKMETYLSREGAECEFVKVGCDYSHLWDHEGGNSENKNSVEFDVKASIEKLCALFPRRRPKCAYCGRYDEHENLYETVTGSLCHHSHVEELKKSGWESWLPKKEPAA